MNEQIINQKIGYLAELRKLIEVECIANHIKGNLIGQSVKVCASIESDLGISEKISQPPPVLKKKF